MSNNEQFDKHIKQQFQGYSPDVHPRIWENIITEREKRKPVGFWFSFFNGRTILVTIALLIAAGGGTYLLLKDNGKNENIIAENSGKKSKTADGPQGSANGQQVTDNGQQATDDKKLTTEQNSNNVPANDQSAANALNNTVTDNNIANSNNNKTHYLGSGSSIRTYTAFATTDENAAAVNTKKKTKNSSVVNNDYDISDADLAAATAYDYYPGRLLFTGPQKISTGKKVAALSKRTFPNLLLSPGCPTFEKDAAGNKTYIEVYGGPDIAFRNLSDTGNSAYLQKRKESTKFSSAFSAGIRYTKVFNNGMSIRTGINYSQINEKFTFTQGNLVQITYIINANGDTTGSYITTGTRYKTTINRFRTIDVPVLIGYEVGNGKLHANINAGIMINAYSWQKGDVLDTAFKPVSITTGKISSPYQFKTNIGLGFMVGTSFYYKINDKVHVLAEPYFRYSLSPMSKENLTLTQKYNTAGLRLGIRVDLH